VQQEAGTSQPTKNRRSDSISTTGPDSIFATLNSVQLPDSRSIGATGDSQVEIVIKAG